MIRLIFPPPGPGDGDLGSLAAADPVGADGGAPVGGNLDLPALYAYPSRPGPAGPGRPWIRANMIASVDGAAALAGRSGGLSGAADQEIFGVLRALADVILVGAGTARAEQYRPARVSPRWAALREGRPAAPPIAVLSGQLDLDPASPLLAQPTAARTIVLTASSAPTDRRAALAAAADVVMAGDTSVQPGLAIQALADRGYQRILAEGGPHLLGQLAAAGWLDEMCLTISPVLAAGDAGRIIQASQPTVGRLTLAHVLASDDSYLFCRYLRQPSA